MKNFTNLVIIIIVICLGVAILAGGGIFIWQTIEKNQLADQKNLAIASLEKTIAETPECQKCETCPIYSLTDEDLPIVIYTPGGLFTDEEKTNLKAKLVDPLIDFESSTDYPVVTMNIQKYDGEDYQYQVDAIQKGGVNAGFLYGEKGKDLNYYQPTCMGPCPFTDEFKEKYPEIVTKDKEVNQVTE